MFLLNGYSHYLNVQLHGSAGAYVGSNLTRIYGKAENSLGLDIGVPATLTVTWDTDDLVSLAPAGFDGIHVPQQGGLDEHTPHNLARPNYIICADLASHRQSQFVQKRTVASR